MPGVKILFLTKYNVVRYGVAEALAGLAAALRPLGVEVLVYSSDSSASIGRLSDGTPCARGLLPKPGGFRGRRSIRHIVELCRQRRIELVHCHGLYRPGYAARAVKRAVGMPYVVTSHGDIVDTSARMRRRSVRRRCATILRDADAVTFLTEAMVQYGNDLCDVRAKSAVIPNGIDLHWWRQPTVVAASANYILAIGRLDQQKGFDVLLNAMKLLAGRCVDLRLVIAGQGQAEPALRRQVRQLGLTTCSRLGELAQAGAGTVCLPGYITGQAKRDLFAGSALVVFPSLGDEGFGLVLIEAMAAGKAIVASNIPAARGLIADGRNGQLVVPGDVAQWADTIQRLVHDDRLRSSFEQANLAEAERYDWATLARRYLDVYQRVRSPVIDS